MPPYRNAGAKAKGDGQTKLILGLGNPGPGYAQTRHNAGFMALDLFAEKNRLEPPTNFKSSVIISGRIDGGKVILAWPLTYMNLSGHAARELYSWYKIEGPGNVLVMHDEMDLPPGRVKVSMGGGAAGHNGIASIKENLPGDFAHVRIGIGRPPKDDWPGQGNSKEWVLSPFEEEELDLVKAGLELAAEAALAWVRGGVAASQRLANKRPKEKKSKEGEDDKENEGQDNKDRAGKDKADQDKDGKGLASNEDDPGKKDGPEKEGEGDF